MYQIYFNFKNPACSSEHLLLIINFLKLKNVFYWCNICKKSHLLILGIFYQNFSPQKVQKIYAEISSLTLDSLKQVEFRFDKKVT